MKGTPSAVRVSLHYAQGCEVSVELFHVCFEGMDCTSEHLVGLREVREQGAAPDESLFQGNKTSFERPAQMPGENVQNANLHAGPSRRISRAVRSSRSCSNRPSHQDSMEDITQKGQGLGNQVEAQLS